MAGAMLFFATTTIVIVCLGIWLFNRLIALRQLTREAWSGIDVQLKRRYDLIPSLTETVKGYAGYEKHLLENVTELRSRCLTVPGIAARGACEAELGNILKGMVAIAENYPDLKANRNFLELQKSLADTEDQLQFARRYYNGTVRDYNVATQGFPGLLIASIWNFGTVEFFELEASAEGLAPKINL